MAATLMLPAELTQRQAAGLLAAWRRQLPSPPQPVLVEASALLRFDSAALALLLDLRRQALVGRQDFKLLNAPRRLQDLAALYGLADLLLPPAP